MLDLFGGGKTLIEGTISRIEGLVEKEQVFISTSSDLLHPLKELTHFPLQQFFIEPISKNTAPAIGLAATYIMKKFGDRVMIVLPSDHRIDPISTFQKQIEQAAQLAWERNILVCFGIPPTRPATGYGYIRLSTSLGGDVYSVDKFVEKPDRMTAEGYLAQGNYLWNAGIFIWRASAILEAIHEYLPPLSDLLKEVQKGIGTQREEEAIHHIFKNAPSISIDFGVMEHHQNVFALRAGFMWDDLGSWESLTNYLPREKDNWSNTNELTTLNAQNNIVDVKGKRVALLGVNDLLIVETEDTLLVSSRKDSEKVGELIALLPQDGS